MSNRVPSPGPRPAPAAPPGQLIYAVGDIHGRADLLERLLAAIGDDAAGRRAERRTLVFLGDYIDRGRDSRGAVDLALAGLDGFEAIHLKGNHEQMLLDALADPRAWPVWLANGGDATLLSYGLWPLPTADPSRALAEALPEAHRRFYEGLALTVEFGDYFFVHAGVSPRAPLTRQDPHDCLWIRDEFLVSDRDFGKVVVHGHTPSPEPRTRANRIGIDTKAWMSGRLTALRLCGEARAFLTTAA